MFLVLILVLILTIDKKQPRKKSLLLVTVVLSEDDIIFQKTKRFFEYCAFSVCIEIADCRRLDIDDYSR